MNFLEINKPNLIWFLTFFTGISLLIYINFGFKNKWIRIIQNAFLVLFTIILSFIFGYLEEKMEFSNTLSELASIGTPLIALFAYWEYKSKTANKVNEKQLESVLEMVEYLTSKKVCRYGQRSSGKEAYKTLQEVLELEKKVGSVEHQIIIENEMTLRTRINNIGIDIELFEDFMDKINYYSKKPLIPNQIKNELEKFHEYLKYRQTYGFFVTAEIEDFKKHVDQIFYKTQKWLDSNQVKEVRLPRMQNEFNNISEN